MDRLSGATDVESKRVAPDCVVKQRVLPITGAAAVEALKTYVEASSVVLERKKIEQDGEFSRGCSLERGSWGAVYPRTIESKHCVQSSLYTDWTGVGGLSSMTTKHELS